MPKTANKATEGHNKGASSSVLEQCSAGNNTAIPNEKNEPLSTRGTSGSAVYEHYYQQAVEKWLRQPFYFASIGFAMPITRMFSGHVVWRRIVYTALMVFAKLICGNWLSRYPSFPLTEKLRTTRLKLTSYRISGPPPRTQRHRKRRSECHKRVAAGRSTPAPQRHLVPFRQLPRTSNPPQELTSQSISSSFPSGRARTSTITSVKPKKPHSIYPASVLGTAMVARGEIGFLISAVPESNGIFEGSNPSIFLILTWAIVLCTVLGPLCVGLLVRRVRLEWA